MKFNKHSNLEGSHAFLGASKYHWINYDEEKLKDSYMKFLAVQRGTELHEFACKCIQLRIRLPKSKATLNSYVNDAIGYKMTPEQPLYYSENCFGTADAISFNGKILRVHDYKSGEVPASMNQLFIYNALFCLEYHFDPFDIEIEDRIYQSDTINYSNPESERIKDIMEKIVKYDKLIREMKEGRVDGLSNA